MRAGDQPREDERRNSVRMAVQKHATIAFRGRALPCKLVDESDSGVRLAEFHTASCPDEFALHVGEGEPRHCSAVWRDSSSLGARYLEDERVRRLRHSIAHFEDLLLAGATAEMAGVYHSEIARARAMLDDLRSAGVPVPDLTLSEKAILAELVREAMQHQRFSLSAKLRQLRSILVKLEVPAEQGAKPTAESSGKAALR